MSKKFSEFIKYSLISAFCTLILYTIFYIVDKVTHGNYLLANFFSYSISFFILFILNQKLFDAKPKIESKKINQIICFVIVRCIGFPIDSLVLTMIINHSNYSNITSKIICSLIMFIYNYLTNKLIVFNKKFNN